jgi:hypothetical protein
MKKLFELIKKLMHIFAVDADQALADRANFKHLDQAAMSQRAWEF